MSRFGHSRIRARGQGAPCAAARTALIVAALVTLLPVLAGCAGLTSSTSSGASSSTSGASSSASAQASSVQATGGAAATAPDGAIVVQQGNVPAKPSPGFSCSNKSLRGCFKESTMETYFEYVLPIIDKFYTSTFPSLKLPAHVYFIPDGVQVQQGCIDETGSHVADDTSYAFCPADGNVYIGQHMAFQLYSLAGDVAPAVGIAHEFGHNIQQQTGVPAPQTNAQTLVHENQADCESGAWLGYANDQHLLEQGDVPVLEHYLELIASSENDPNRDHGDFDERGQALETGGEKGISACNAFYPSTPIAR